MTALLDKTTVRDAVAAEITRAREDAGISKRELARRLDVKPTYVVQWEQGQGVSQHYVYSVDQALGLTPGTIYQRVGERIGSHLGCIGYTRPDQPLLPHQVETIRTLVAAA